MQVRAEETNIITEIKDCFGRLRYRISFSEESPAWVVKVIDCLSEELPVLYRAEFSSRCEAEEDFRKRLKDYGMLVEAETRKPQDIEIFKDKVNYRLTDPDRCEVCKHCHERKGCRRGSLECWNPENYIDKRAIREPGRHLDDPRRKYHPDWRFGDDIRKEKNFRHIECDRNNGRPYPDRFWERPTEPEGIDVHPKVSRMGICDSFEREENFNDISATVSNN